MTYVPLPRQAAQPPLVDPEPLRAWLLAAFPDWPVKTLARYLGEEDEQTLGKLLRGKPHKRVSLHTADRLLTAAGRPDLLAAFYPVEDA